MLNSNRDRFVMKHLVASAVMAAAATTGAPAGGIQAASQPAGVVVRNGTLTLHALFWRPAGPGPFPAVLFNHGSGRTKAELRRLGPYENNAYKLGPVFANRAVSVWERDVFAFLDEYTRN